ncbi:hypothetical protein [Thermus scotoductus]|uniref:hypothetical protein n=1 Tax=Thermus scotoductus TaxID=37636 RepID=UPI0020A309B3|nr:hypothetical protein [Thermus scotoductus]
MGIRDRPLPPREGGGEGLPRPGLKGEKGEREEATRPEALVQSLRRLLAYAPLRPYLLLSLLFTLAHALTTALLGLLALRAGTPEALFGLVFVLQSLGYTRPGGGAFP